MNDSELLKIHDEAMKQANCSASDLRNGGGASSSPRLAGSVLNAGKVSVIIPAPGNPKRLSATLETLIHRELCNEIIVVDDGKRNGSARTAAIHGVRSVSSKKSRNRGAACNAGLAAALGEFIVFLNPELGDSAGLVLPLIETLRSGKSDVAIGTAQYNADSRLACFLSSYGVAKYTGFRPTAPLSAPIALRRRALESVYPLRPDFGMETALLIKAAKAGFRIEEIELGLPLRKTIMNLFVLVRRFRQTAGVARALLTAVFSRRIKKSTVGQKSKNKDR